MYHAIVEMFEYEIVISCFWKKASVILKWSCTIMVDNRHLQSLYNKSILVWNCFCKKNIFKYFNNLRITAPLTKLLEGKFR